MIKKIQMNSLFIQELPPTSFPTACHARLLEGYRGTSLIRSSALLGPYSGTMHRALCWVLEGVNFL